LEASVFEAQFQNAVPQAQIEGVICFVIMEPISSEEVRAEVYRFWNVLSSKSKDKFEGMYFPSAVVFSSTARQTEPGRLMLARRVRQFFVPAISIRAEVGAINVQLVGTNVAIAAYVYRFRSAQTESDGTKVNRETPFGRATQIFQRDEGGALRIIHEHMSSSTAPTVERIPPG
jgi:ketosteroid isomerase-like protein